MVAFHNRVPRPAPSISAFRSGRVDVDFVRAQAGSTTIQLLVFRPGATTAERVKVGVYCWFVNRGVWPIITMLALVLAPPPARAGGLLWWTGFAAFVTVVLVGGAWLLARPTLADAHGIRVGVRASKRGPLISGDLSLLEEYANRLGALERAGLHPVEYEIEWSRIYDDLAASDQVVPEDR